jgi:glycosyltransferase involved in cell wall biosynthesis
MKSHLIDLSKRLGVVDKVYLLGHVSDSKLAALYKLSSIAVFPSIYEPFGIVALEAMGAGVPVIASATGGLEEIIQDGFNGLKFVSGSSDSLAYQIRRAANDSALTDYLVRNAHQTANKYSWESAAESTMDVYRRVLDEYGRSTWKPTF